MSLLVFVSRALINKLVNTRTISFSKFSQLYQQNKNSDADLEFRYVYDYDPKDRSEVIDVETSIKYLESKAYKDTYGDNPVWFMYRRPLTKHKFKDTRISCIKLNKLIVSSPCPICRDKYLVPHYTNIKLLKQFISPDYGDLLPTKLTGVCQKQQKNIRIAFLQAKDYGKISFDVPSRSYDYEYLEELSKKTHLLRIFKD